MIANKYFVYADYWYPVALHNHIHVVAILYRECAGMSADRQISPFLAALRNTVFAGMFTDERSHSVVPSHNSGLPSESTRTVKLPPL